MNASSHPIKNKVSPKKDRLKKITATKTSSGRQTGNLTLDDVARVANVSPITVSRVLNQPDLVAKATAEKVHNAIERIGYVPNLLASSLASKKSRLIAMVVPSIINPVYAETVRALSDRLTDSGYQVFLGESGFTEEAEKKLLFAILSRRPDAICLTGIPHLPETRRLLINAKIPIVETWDITPTPLDTVVGFSHEAVGKQVADFLVNKGYKRIGILSADDPRGRRRQQEFVKTLEGHGITDVPKANVPAPPDLASGRTGAGKLIDLGFQNGVIFCSSDTLARGVLTEARVRGISVPKDLAVMGFGDQNFAAHTFPALSTVKIDRSMMGNRAVEAIISAIEGKSNIDKVIDIGFEIVERETT